MVWKNQNFSNSFEFITNFSDHHDWISKHVEMMVEMMHVLIENTSMQSINYSHTPTNTFLLWKPSKKALKVTFQGPNQNSCGIVCLLSIILITDPTMRHLLISKGNLPDHLLWIEKIFNYSEFLFHDEIVCRANDFTWRHRNETKSKLYLCNYIINVNYRGIHLWTNKITY